MSWNKPEEETRRAALPDIGVWDFKKLDFDDLVDESVSREVTQGKSSSLINILPVFLNTVVFLNLPKWNSIETIERFAELLISFDTHSGWLFSYLFVCLPRHWLRS